MTLQSNQRTTQSGAHLGHQWCWRLPRSPGLLRGQGFRKPAAASVALLTNAEPQILALLQRDHSRWIRFRDWLLCVPRADAQTRMEGRS